MGDLSEFHPDAEPVDEGTAPCPGILSLRGKCFDCGQRVASTKITESVPVSRVSPDGKLVRRQPVPHERNVRSYIIDDPSECSCGGLHGELGQLERVSCLRQKIGGEPKITCRECGQPRSAHPCPTDATERAPSALAVVTMVDETAKSVMRAQGRDPETWDALSNEVRDALRLLALDRLRSLA